MRNLLKPLGRWHLQLLVLLSLCHATMVFSQETDTALTTTEAPIAVESPAATTTTESKFDALTKALTQGSLPKRAQTAKKLAQLNDSRVASVIAALQQGTLYATKSTDPLVAIAVKSGKFVNALNGETITGDTSDLKRVPINNTMRSQLRTLLAALNLNDKQASVRLNAVNRMIADGVDDIKDLKPGMQLEGTVTNVAAFGAFVDIGVHQDGLVHISALSEKFIKDPHEAVKAGDVVKVKVMEVDIPRNRIALSMRMGDTPGEKIEGPRGGARGGKPAGNAPRSERHSSQDKPAPASGGMAALFANAKQLKK